MREIFPKNQPAYLERDRLQPELIKIARQSQSRTDKPFAETFAAALRRTQHRHAELHSFSKQQQEQLRPYHSSCVAAQLVSNQRRDLRHRATVPGQSDRVRPRALQSQPANDLQLEVPGVRSGDFGGGRETIHCKKGQEIESRQSGGSTITDAVQVQGYPEYILETHQQHQIYQAKAQQRLRTV